MATSYTSEKIAYNNALNLKLFFGNAVANSVGFVFIGNHLPYEDEENPDSIVSCEYSERRVWENMFAAKKITENNVELVIPKLLYSNTESFIYRQYDDTIELSELVSANAQQNLKPMYVINSEGNVYKCLSNNNGSFSLKEPTGDFSTNESGNIFISEDGYIWKYMYNVSDTNDFQTSNWIPVPTSTGQIGYNSSKTVSIDGEINTIHVTESGNGYVNSVVTVESFSAACTILTITANTFNSSNLYYGMGIQGKGIIGDVFITSINVESRQVTISNSSYTAAGGVGNNYSIVTRVVVDGDGRGFDGSDRMQAIPVLDPLDGSVQQIIVTEDGRDYNYASVLIYGTGSNAAARAIVSPKYGHAYNPAKELNAKNVMISMDIGESGDASESNVISEFTSYRQYGLLLNPYKYGETSPVTYQKANNVVSQAFEIYLDSGPNFDIDEYVYQGIPLNPSFIGYVNSRIGDTGLRLTRIKGKPSKSLLLKSAAVPTGRQITVGEVETDSWKYGYFQPYTGDIVRVENVEKIQRNEGQTENIKMIVKF